MLNVYTPSLCSDQIPTEIKQSLQFFNKNYLFLLNIVYLTM